jgi:hypothetical protein
MTPTEGLMYLRWLWLVGLVVAAISAGAALVRVVAPPDVPETAAPAVPLRPATPLDGVSRSGGGPHTGHQMTRPTLTVRYPR